MDNGRLLVNFAALGQAGADIEHALHELQTQLADLEKYAAPLVEDWTGEANEAYKIRQARWRAASNDLAEILRNIQGAVVESTANYAQTEKAATRRFS